MPEQLLFHEKCTDDVRAILQSLTQNDHDTHSRKNEFLSRLTEGYQLIFENPTTNAGFVFEKDIRWDQRIDKKIVKIFGFPYLIVYTVLPSRTPVVLGIISSSGNILSAEV